MKDTYLQHRIALSLLFGVGPYRAKELIESLESLDELFHRSPRDLEKRTGYKASFFKKMNRDNALEAANGILEFHQKGKMDILYFEDDNYPRRLNNCADAPIVLYSKGDVNFNKSKFVSIVGTRSATQYGEKICADLIHSFKDKDIVVVSGLAYGIDAIVHRFCIDFNVPTIGVLGHGLDKIYPHSHRNLAKMMIRSGGAVLTEFIPGTNPDRENFPRRNRIVAGMTDATIVVESKESGGSLITANLAFDYNRDVFAYPGSVEIETCRGCNKLIADEKAHLIQTPVDFLRKMNWISEKKVSQSVQRKIFPNLTKQQDHILQIIRTNDEIHIDVLAHKANLSISNLNIELFQLEMEGAIRVLPGKLYSVL